MQLNSQLTVSVIMPAYNHAHLLGEAIDSVLAQTYKDIEIIVVDDGSTDNTKEALAPYIKSGSIRYIYQENRGLSAARNTGLKAAQGVYIKFLDSDDFLYPEQIEGQVNQIKDDSNFLSISDCCFLQPSGKIVVRKYYPPDPERQLNVFIETNQAPVHAFLIPKALIEKAGGFDETLTACEDWDLWLRILQGGAVTKHLPYVGCCYRISATSMSSDAKKMLLQSGKVIEKVNTWLLREENLAQFLTKPFWFDSICKINTRLIDESMARQIPFEPILPNALRMMDVILNNQLKGVQKALFKIIGTPNYLRAKYHLKVLLKKNYKFKLLNEEDLWKFGEIPGKVPHFVFFRRLTPDADWGGTEVVLMNWFSKIDYQRCRITLAVPKGSTRKFLPKIQALHIPVAIAEYEFLPWKTRGWEKFSDMRKFFLKLKPSKVVFVQGWYIDFDLSHILAAVSVVGKNIFMHENVGPDMPPAKASKKYFGFIPGLALWWYKQVFAVCGKAYFCRNVLFVSQDIRQKFIQLWKYPQRNALVMYHGTELSKFFPSHDIRKAVREQMGVAESETVIIATARLAKFKCLDRLINAFDLTAQSFKNLRLLLVGTGPLEQEFKTLAESKNSRDRIRFLGHVDNVPELLKMSDIYVLSSDNEGLSLALMESMASGLICISTNCPGSNEIIEDGVNGFLVERSTEGVLRGLQKALHLTPEEKLEISQEARKTVDVKFNIDHNVKRIFDVFGVPALS